MRERISRVIRTVCLAALLLPVGIAHAENSAAAIKTAFVYNFAKFVEWPANAFADERSPLELCVSGLALEGRLQLLEGREAQGHPIRIRALSGREALAGCHILVLGDQGAAERAQLLQAAGRGPVLTIADSGEFPREGGMIGLFVAANRVQFSVNLGAAQGAGLRMSARLLQLAHSVHGGTP